MSAGQAVHYLPVEWFWVAALLAIVFGPIVVMLIRRERGEGLSQGPDSLMEAYRKYFDDWPRRRP
jgi:hypothetical protein